MRGTLKQIHEGCVERIFESITFVLSLGKGEAFNAHSGCRVIRVYCASRLGSRTIRRFETRFQRLFFGVIKFPGAAPQANMKQRLWR